MNMDYNVYWIYRYALTNKGQIRQSFLARLYGRFTNTYRISILTAASHPEPPNNIIKTTVGLKPNDP